MFRMSYKPRTHHRDAYSEGDSISMLLRVNGRDLLDAATARQTFESPRAAAARHHRQPTRKFTDAQVAAMAHAAKLAEKVAA